MVNLINVRELLIHDRSIMVGNVGYNLVGFVSVCLLALIHS